MKLNQKLAKKVLAVALTLAMVVTSLFVMPTTANAATGATIGRYQSVKAATTVQTKVKNLGKNYYAMVSVTGTAKNGVTITNESGTKVTATTKIQGTGSNIILNVKNYNVPGKSYKLTIKTYSKSTNKLVRTFTTGSTFVYKLTTKVTLDQTTLALAAGDTATLTATKAPATSTQSITWSSSDTAVATVSKGVVTAVASGTATITAKSGTKTATCVVTVGDAKLTSTTATGAKKITLTFASNCTYTTSDFVVKKGSATPSISSVAIDGKTAVITLGSKMTEGTYTVTVKDQTGSVTVASETLTSFALVNNNLVQRHAIGDTYDSDHSYTAASGIIYYTALNQYGEKMSASAPTVTCSFGSAVADAGNYYEAGNIVAPSSSNSYVGYIVVTSIPSTLAIIGTTGSLVLVDSTTGVSATTSITYAAKATASTLTVAGLYNTSTATVDTMTAGDTVSNFAVLMTVTDQYGNYYDADALKAASNLTITPVSGLTNVSCEDNFDDAGAYDVTIDDVDYVALPLATATSGTTKAIAGTFYINIVNTAKGLLTNTSFTVSDSTTIKSLTVAASDTIYAEQNNTIELTALDGSGNEVTSYNDLLACSLTMTSSLSADKIRLVKKSDGTGVIYYTPDQNSITDGSTNSETRVLTFTANGTSSSNYLVKTLTVKVYAAKVATAITGVTSSAQKACANDTEATFEIYKGYLIIEDQYQNAMTSSEKKLVAVDYAIGTGSGIAATSGAIAVGTTYVDINPDDDTIGTATVTVSINGVTDSDYSYTIYTVNAEYATNLQISEIHGGYDYEVTTSTTDCPVDSTDVVVTGTVSGRTIVLPTSMYVISDSTFESISSSEGTTTKTGTVTITVDTSDGTNAVSTDLTGSYTYSNKTEILTYLSSKGKTSVTTTDATLDSHDFIGLFHAYSQFGSYYVDGTSTWSVAAVKYSVVVEEMTGCTATLTHNNTNSCSLALSGWGTGDSITLYITSTFGGNTISQEVTFEY